MRTTALFISYQFVNTVEWEVMAIIQTNVKIEQNVSIVEKIIYQVSVNVKFGNKNEIMKLKVTKHLAHHEARKPYHQQPEFTFAKVVQSPSAKPE